MLKDLDIPSVRERDPDPESGPRLNVLKFKLQGIVEYPELGITRAEIEKLIESIRFDMMKEFDLLDSGFTQSELTEVSKLLVEIEDETLDRHVTDVDLQKLISLVREQRSKRGITLGTIETVADKITRFYRERGFILAKAYIPEQQVRDGVVTLTLLLGTLGEVEVIDNQRYSADKIASTFDDMLTMPVTADEVEENLYLLNDYPGLSVTGFFQPGQQVGDTKLNINVKNERVYDSSIRLDNHGSEQTGEYRLYAEAKWHNPTGLADQLHIAALNAFNPSNTTYGQIRYQTRLFSPRLNLSLGAATNDFVLGPGNSEAINKLDLFGNTRQQDITLSYTLKRGRVENYYLDLKQEKIESSIRIGSLASLGDVGLDDIVNNTVLTLRYDLLDEENKMLHQGDLSVTGGQFELGNDIGQDENYNIFNANYTLLTFFKIPFIDSSTRVIYRASVQYASSPLSSISQFATGGPTRARAYSVSQFSADNAGYMGIDWVFDAPDFISVDVGKSNLVDMIRPFIFADAAYGEVLALFPGDKDRTGMLTDVGIGFQFSYFNQFSGNLMFAFPQKSRFDTDDIVVEDDNMRIVFDMQYSF